MKDSAVKPAVERSGHLVVANAREQADRLPFLITAVGNQQQRPIGRQQPARSQEVGTSSGAGHQTSAG